MSGDGNTEDSKKRGQKIIPVIIILAGVYFFYDQYTTRQEQKIINSNTAANVEDKMKKKNFEIKTEVKKDEVAVPKKEATVPPVEIRKVEEPKPSETPFPEPAPPVSIETKTEPPQITFIPKPPETETAKPALIDENEEIVFTTPPLYTTSGKGLVYNCVGKHWACVNANEYLKCKRNMNWNKSQNALTECITVEIYASEVDCETMQTQNVSDALSTPFCIQDRNESKKIRKKTSVKKSSR